MTRRIAVVGAGMAAARFAERFQALGGDAEVTLYGAEPRAPYNRVLLADVLTGRYAADDLTLPAGDARLRTGCEVTGLDTVARTLRLADGEDVPYDELVLATGAEPVLPAGVGGAVRLWTGCAVTALDTVAHTSRPADGALVPYDELAPATGAKPVIRGGLRQGPVHVVRTAGDCEGLAGAAARARHAAVIGGGVLGVSVARALASRGLPVTIVHQAPHLVERDLDGPAGELLRRALTGLGVEVRTGTTVRAVDGDGRVGLSDGHTLGTGLVVAACGVRPRTALARAAGLPVRTGVVVDDRLSCAPDVYAIGDCAEHRDRTHGTAGAAWEQADVLAARLSGAAPDAAYAGSRPYARLSAGPLEYAAFGDPAADEGGLDVLRIADATRGSYKKLVLRGDRIAGAILLGDLATVGALARAYERDEIVPADPFHLLTSSPSA
ncbi:NAD(P)/FAD-dependent oxidoreductase [Streptomyces roseoverticillatus]|uniref:NAD(P)/FAD-dependent oxidoreductase n=1 Tax=Streptomyces roseoverticillatus TaxID=66429 RepID=UPI001F3B939F|nr:FAD-dependent oxidoreductase [Streptomyces roseoverticillatus]MCF3100357.1 NAD(P)/FAD-dependent oxidoreductase [Streptomyces roseoverticillatus]